MEEVAQKVNGQRPAKGSVEELKAALGISDIRLPEDGGGAEIDLQQGGLLFNLLGQVGDMDEILKACVLRLQLGVPPERTESGLILPR